MSVAHEMLIEYTVGRAKLLDTVLRKRKNYVEIVCMLVNAKEGPRLAAWLVVRRAAKVPVEIHRPRTLL